jgi:hypothetical protein
MSDKDKAPIADEKLDEVSGGYVIERGKTLVPGGFGPPPVRPPQTPVPHVDPC